MSYGFRSASGIWTNPRFREFWVTQRTGFNPDFVAAFEVEYDLAP